RPLEAPASSQAHASSSGGSGSGGGLNAADFDMWYSREFGENSPGAAKPQDGALNKFKEKFMGFVDRVTLPVTKGTKDLLPTSRRYHTLCCLFKIIVMMADSLTARSAAASMLLQRRQPF